MKDARGLINRIIYFSCVDGPGNRMVIFLQGCNLNCINCHNPHTIGLCNFCGICIEECPANALKIVKDNDSSEIIYDEIKCINCDLCLKLCPVNSNPRTRWIRVDEVIEEIIKVAPFISGITVSGGEATQQLDFVIELFTSIKNDKRLNNLTTFIDSNGITSIKTWEKLSSVLDGAMIDLKAIDDKIHLMLTGESNKSVLETISYLYEKNKLYEVRLLMIPGYNTDENQIKRTAEFLKKSCLDVKLRLIPFRKHGVREEALKLMEPDTEFMNNIKDFFKQYGFTEIIVT